LSLFVPPSGTSLTSLSNWAIAHFFCWIFFLPRLPFLSML
jgi:hypothetical protein